MGGGVNAQIPATKSPHALYMCSVVIWYVYTIYIYQVYILYIEARHSVQAAAVVVFYGRGYIEEFNIYSVAYSDLLLASLSQIYAHCGVHQGRVRGERISQNAEEKSITQYIRQYSCAVDKNVIFFQRQVISRMSNRVFFRFSVLYDFIFHLRQQNTVKGFYLI